MNKKTLISIIACVIALVLVIIGTCVAMKYKTEQPTDVTEITIQAYGAGGASIRTTEQDKEQISTTQTTVPITEETTIITTTEKIVETTKAETTTKKETTTEPKVEKTTESSSDYELKYSAPYNVCSNHLTAPMGVKYYNGHRETWYSQKVLPGGGLKIPGRHVADDGTIRDGDGYIVVASDLSYLSRGSVVMTSLGPGKVYDTGCAYGTIDIYVNW
jgi:hypothetical protein